MMVWPDWLSPTPKEDSRPLLFLCQTAPPPSLPASGALAVIGEMFLPLKMTNVPY